MLENHRNECLYGMNAINNKKSKREFSKKKNGSTTIASTALAGTALGTACVVAAPVAAAVGVGWAISKVWNAIWD